MKEHEIKAEKYADKIQEISNTLEKLVWEMVQDLRESEQRYRSIVEFAADAIISIDRDKKVTSWNKGAQNIFGYSEEEAVAREIDDLIVREQVSNEAQRLSEKVLKGDSFHSLEAVRYTKDGTPKNVLISAAPILSKGRKVEAVSLMYKDITDLKLAHEQLVQTEKQATLGVIAGSIGHELNNLIGGLLVQAKLLQQHADEPERVREVNEIFLTNLEKVALHGKNLLSLSRPTKPQFEPLDLNSVLRDTTETLILSGILKRFKIEYNLHNSTNYIMGDRNLMEQVIRNLEINASHAMPDGGNLLLTTKLSADDKHLELIVRDTGMGIAEDIKSKIFQPFYTTKAEGQGTGLGLPIVKDIVEQHNGSVVIESKIGTGTAVTVSIPVANF
ncbi:MAG: PAS domain S-box protein [Actinobacteria bacterium]|nr:PAS domain S-box protein [Actinomycetota bacterium]